MSTLTGALTANGGTTTTDLTATGTSTLTTTDINGGNIDGTAIGSSTASSGAFTTLSASGNTTIAGNLSVADGAVTINSSGLSVNGANVIKREANGAVHIGENSLITNEVNGRQQLYSQDGSGKAIPIDITNGSKLLINGRDVEQSIDNVGALSAALTGLPTIPTDSPIACGLGTGTHGGNYAFSGGCASRVNEKLAFNAAASFVPRQDYQGKDNGFSARAGFVFKLGKIEKTKDKIEEIKIFNSKIKKDILNLSKNKKKNAKDIEALNKLLKKQTELLASLEKDNEILKENNKLILSENEQLISRLEDLISRLEKIDKLAPTNFDISRK